MAIWPQSLNPRFDGAFLNYVENTVISQYANVLIPDLMGLF